MKANPCLSSEGRQKKRYATREAAEHEMARWLSKMSKNDPAYQRMMTYECLKCGFFHVGRSTNVVRTRRPPARPKAAVRFLEAWEVA